MVLLPVVSVAQIQRGLVRTNGSADNTDVSPLSGVLVKAVGCTNTTKSGKDGTIDIMVENRVDGTPYVLSRVFKKDYELYDPMLIGRELAYSSRTPLEIVMIPCKELNRVRTEIEERIHNEVQRRYSAAISCLNDSLSRELITIENFRRQINFLDRQRDMFEPLIGVMANHYARTDFTGLDSLDRKINLSIIAGDIETADALLAQKGRLEDRIAALERRKELYGQADELVKSISESLKEQRRAYEGEREDVAEDLYHKYTISLARFNPKEAADFITLRAALDDTNIEYQLDAGAFMLEYAADFEKSSAYYERALSQSEREYGHQSAMTAHCLNHLGGLRLSQSRFDDALTLRNEALNIRKALYGEIHPEVANCYNNLANIYYAMENAGRASVCADSAVYIHTHDEEVSLPELAEAYNTKGGVELMKGNMAEALSMYELSVAVADSVYGPVNAHSAVTVNNIGVINDYLGNSERAIGCYRRALTLFKKIYGERHPDVASVYSNLGTLYESIGRVDSAMICQTGALEMRVDMLGQFHEDVATSLNNLGALCSSMGQYDVAIDFYGKALTVLDVVVGDNTMRFATTLGNIGTVYYRRRDWVDAINYFDAALNVYNRNADQSGDKIGSTARLEAKCYEELLRSGQLTGEGRKEAEKDYGRLKSEYAGYLNDI